MRMILTPRSAGEPRRRRPCSRLSMRGQRSRPCLRIPFEPGTPGEGVDLMHEDGASTTFRRPSPSYRPILLKWRSADEGRSYKIFERLAGADPGNAGWQRDLSVSHNKIGDVLRAQGNLTAALESYQASLAIAERLAGADPGNAGWQRDLAFSHWRLAQYGNQPRFHWQQVVSILRELEKQGRLAPTDQKWLPTAEKNLAA